ncbi:MAG: cytidylate kinase-like family protein [Anaerolineae bacterium]
MAVITISRQFGSGGKQITRRVCELLGYRYFDKELIAQVATEVGLSEHEAIDFSEEHYKGKRLMDRLLYPAPYTVAHVPTWRQDESGAESFSVTHLDEAKFVNLVRGIILAAYDRGNVVILGRGGQAVLANMLDVLHVRIEAPWDVRVGRVQEREHLAFETARQMVAERDRIVAKYLNDLFKVQPDDPQWYHLILNTGKWSLEAAAQLIVTAVNQLQPEPVAV